MREEEKIPRRKEAWTAIKKLQNGFPFNTFYEATKETIYRTANGYYDTNSMRQDLRHFMANRMLKKTGHSRDVLYYVIAKGLTSQDALHIAKNILYWHMSDESCVHNIRYVLHNRFRHQTNLTGTEWLKIFDYLGEKNYALPFEPIDDDKFEAYYHGHP